MTQLIWRFYKKTRQSNKMYFFVLVLQRLHISTAIRIVLEKYEDKIERRNPTQEMIQARAFFENNNERVKRIKLLLEDEKSRKVYDAVIEYRTRRKAIPRNLYEIGNQYFEKDIISLEPVGGVMCLLIAGRI